MEEKIREKEKKRKRKRKKKREEKFNWRNFFGEERFLGFSQLGK